MPTSPSQWNGGQYNAFQWNQGVGANAAGQTQGPPSFTQILDGSVVPLTNAANQQLTISLPINGTTVDLNLAVNFNEVGQFWVMSVSDQSGNPLFSDVPLITGYWPGGNLLAQYNYAQIGGCTVINQSGGAGDWPGVNGWGPYQLIWYSNSEYLLASGGVQ
jgi:hypothetical protein